MVRVLCYGHKSYRFESCTRLFILFNLIGTCCKRFYVLIADRKYGVQFLRVSHFSYFSKDKIREK